MWKLQLLYLNIWVLIFMKQNQSRNQHNELGFWVSQLVFTCSKLTIETLEQSVKYIQS